MTSTTGATQHPDVSEISNLTEGLLSPTRTADVRRHLTECELCTDVRDSLSEIRDLLGSLPGPQHMPADIADRIDAALAAEALLDATAPVDVSRETGDKEASATRMTDLSREPSPASEAAVSELPDRPSGHPRGATGPGRTSRTRRHRTGPIVIGSLFTAAAIGLGTLLVQSIGSGTFSSSEDGGSASSTQADAHAFTEGDLHEDVHSLLGDAEAGATAPSIKPSPESFGVESERGIPKPKAEVSLPSCVQAGLNRAETPLAAQSGSYHGTTAYLVVLPDRSDSSQVNAYIVDATCVDNAPTGKADILLTRTYSHP